MEQSLETVYVHWDNGQEYIFKGRLLIDEKRGSAKTAWRGKFIEEAPAGLKPDVEYCLKQIVVTREENAFPQKREYYDVVEFQGDHQRKILAKNYCAAVVEEELKTTGLKVESRTCYVVEPAYDRVDKWFKECWKYPVHERLDLIGQFALGCKELKHPINNLQGHKVDAHRDIKPDNGMIYTVDGKHRVVLIDYASIHLESTEDNWTREEPADGDGTYGGFMSPSNTAPEDLHYTDWNVCDTTDVYALGMMLSSMFVHTEVAYISLSGTWFRLIKKTDAAMDQKDRCMSREFKNCWTRFDQNVDEGTAWVEKALLERNVQFRWEDLPDKEVLRQIRRLFVRATRIDPKNRISLEEFIREIYRIRDMARDSRERFEVSLYLFEKTDFDKYGDAYAKTAANTFQKEGEAKALCVEYHRARLENIREASKCQEYPCQNGQEIDDFVSQVSRCNSNGLDTMVFAMYHAGRRLDELSWAYEFTGNVYIFCHRVPGTEEIAGGMSSLQRVLSMLKDRWEKNVFIDVHAILDCEADDEDPKWYSFNQISYHEPDRVYQEKQKPVDPNMRPYGQLYATMPDGSIFWI